MWIKSEFNKYCLNQTFQSRFRFSFTLPGREHPGPNFSIHFLFIWPEMSQCWFEIQFHYIWPETSWSQLCPVRNVTTSSLESCFTLSDQKRPDSDKTIQNSIGAKYPDQIKDKQAITVLNKSITLCHHVVVTFGVKDFYRQKKNVAIGKTKTTIVAKSIPFKETWHTGYISAILVQGNNFCYSSRKHTYIMLTPLNPSLI